MIQPGKYRHFKGNEYEVLSIATHSETLEPMVVYRPLYGEGKLWVRPVSMWEELVELDGKLVPRFSYIPKEYTNALSQLWYNGDEPAWEKALVHYHTLYKDVTLETFMAELKPETVEQMTVSEFYDFLHDKYFVWKYTAKTGWQPHATTCENILTATNFNSLSRYIVRFFLQTEAKQMIC